MDRDLYKFIYSEGDCFRLEYLPLIFLRSVGIFTALFRDQLFQPLNGILGKQSQFEFQPLLMSAALHKIISRNKLSAVNLFNKFRIRHAALHGPSMFVVKAKI